jgi:hypothetical protein
MEHHRLFTPPADMDNPCGLLHADAIASGFRRGREAPMSVTAFAGRIVTTLGLLAGPAIVSGADASPRLVQPAPNPHIACTCRANGRSYALGERVCLSTAGGYRLAQCRMQQNVTSWAIGPDPCVVSAGPASVNGGPTC